MKMKTLLGGFAAIVGLAVAGAAAAQSFPEKPIKWMVPYNPGGGTDATARFIQAYIEKNNLLPQPIAMVNVAGAGGSIGARQAKDEPADGYTILIHQTALLIRDAGGMSDFGFKDFEPIISLNRQCMLPAVRNDSEYKTYKELMDAAKTSPGKIVWGGNIGSSNHMAIASMEAVSPGAEFKKLQVGGGAESYAGLKGGIIEVGNFGIGEILSFKSDIRPLALLADERDPAIADVPTARELGYDAIYCNEHNLYAPKGTPADRIAVIREAVEKALNSDEIRTSYSEKLGASIKIRKGKELFDHLSEELERIRPMAKAMAAN
jgi:tripartite-type tricarboxylate transporter receptor subunit TctC